MPRNLSLLSRNSVDPHHFQWPGIRTFCMLLRETVGYQGQACIKNYWISKGYNLVGIALEMEYPVSNGTNSEAV